MSLQKPHLAERVAPAVVTMLFLFNLVYASTWGTVAFLVPTEIFPSDLRAQGNGFGITGWAIGVGMTVLVNPIMFADIKVSNVASTTRLIPDREDFCPRNIDKLSARIVLIEIAEPDLFSLCRSKRSLDPDCVSSIPRDGQKVTGVH